MRLALEEADAVGPVAPLSLSHQIREGPHLATYVRRSDGPFINENDTAVLPLFFCPSFEQWWNCPPIVGNQSQSFPGSMLQQGRVVLPQLLTILPFLHRIHRKPSMTAAKTVGNTRRDMFIEEKLEHLAISLCAWN